MIDFISSSGSGSGGSDTLSGAARVRTVRLVRPPSSTLPPPGLTCKHGPGFGFSIRGGREHGTGFFVSHVELGSEAHRQGLKIGDQIIRINGFTIEDAVHKEVLQLISNHTHLILKVRSVGMIPVKEKATDPLSWQIIPDVSSILSVSPLEEKTHDVRISITVAQKAKLGCGICKGPEWKPGIFVQFTKEAGIARDAGIRPGDQILSCNNIDFTDISFNEAVTIMKTSKHLDLIVRKGAGSELFPGESSGYNSSASSVTGDQSPSWSESKRLSIVKEESLELEDRLSHLDLQRFKPKSWEKINYDWDENHHHFKPTIINLTENGSTIKNNGLSVENQNFEQAEEKLNAKLADICLMSQQHETKTVVVEVHRSDLEEKSNDSIKKSPSCNSFSSSISKNSSTSSSLSSAISLELQRRSERNKEAQKKLNIDEEVQKRKTILKGVDTDKQHQHDKLMDEFKKAHRKMFSSTVDKDHELNEKQKNEQESSIKDRQLSQRRCTIAAPEEVSDRLTTPFPGFRNNCNTSNAVGSSPPPPPPPMPGNESSAVIKSKNPLKAKAPPVPQKSFHQPLPPPCPTPDYDTISLSSSHGASNAVTNQENKDGVEMESLESFKLNTPSATQPKPPNTYFGKGRLGRQTNLEAAKQRPVSVTIGEYPSGVNKRQPIKFDFLNPGNGGDQVDSPKNQPITSRFASELAQTLSRSNLRKRTEDIENAVNGSIKPQTNGTVTISVNDTKKLFQMHKPLSKSQSVDCTTRNFSKNLGNRVTIQISDSEREIPNSILKNGNGNGNNCSSQHKPLVHQKSITFGEITTVINDRPMHVT